MVNTKHENRILSVKDLVVQYTSDKEVVHAVNKISFDLNYGETIGLVGETGAGKTTIAKSILRILPDPPAKITDGQIILDDKDILTISEDEMRKVRGRKISMVFQDPMTALNPVITVGEQIAEVVRNHFKVSNAEANERAKEMLELVGIPADRSNEYAHQFSGGMKQRVVIAIALACKPNLLIADEPTTALDVTIQAQVLEMIRELQHQQNTAMIMITHDFGIVAETCDNVAVVYAGEIVEYGTKRQVLKNPSHPYTVGLLNAIPTLNSNVDRLRPIDGLPPDPTNLPSGCYFSPRCPIATEECRIGSVPNIDIGDGHKCLCHRPGTAF